MQQRCSPLLSKVWVTVSWADNADKDLKLRKQKNYRMICSRILACLWVKLISLISWTEMGWKHIFLPGSWSFQAALASLWKLHPQSRLTR